MRSPRQTLHAVNDTLSTTIQRLRTPTAAEAVRPLSDQLANRQGHPIPSEESIFQAKPSLTAIKQFVAHDGLKCTRISRPTASHCTSIRKSTCQQPTAANRKRAESNHRLSGSSRLLLAVSRTVELSLQSSFQLSLTVLVRYRTRVHI